MAPSMQDSRASSVDLHGSAPDKSPVALLIIDAINDLEFPEADQLLQFALPMAERLAKFKRQLKAAGIPAVYVNDNFGRWRSDFRAQVEHCLHDGVAGQPIVKLLHPEEDDYFVLKPKHSGFFSTTLDVLLRYLQVHTVIVTGIATDICVLFTANDAYMHDYKLYVPADCVAANTEEKNSLALKSMRELLKANITPSTELSVRELVTKVQLAVTAPT